MGELFVRTARLFARPSFIEGSARVLDVGATLNEYNKNETSEEADREAILSDWLAVGDSIGFALGTFEKKQRPR